MEKTRNPATFFLMPKSATQALKTPVFGPVSLVFRGCTGSGHSKSLILK